MSTSRRWEGLGGEFAGGFAGGGGERRTFPTKRKRSECSSAMASKVCVTSLTSGWSGATPLRTRPKGRGDASSTSTAVAGCFSSRYLAVYRPDGPPPTMHTLRIIVCNNVWGVGWGGVGWGREGVGWGWEGEGWGKGGKGGKESIVFDFNQAFGGSGSGSEQ